MLRALTWTGTSLRYIDQTKLPLEESVIETTDYRDVVQAIKRLAIRGAPAIGVAGAFAAALAAREFARLSSVYFTAELRKVVDDIRTARPTAVNLRWALDRMCLVLSSSSNEPPELIAERMVQRAQEILHDDEERCRAIGENGAPLLKDGWDILTHCNTGALATAGDGTALNVIRTAAERGKHLHVFVDETRPLLQGARLTTWELRRLSIPHTLITDGMGAFLMQQGRVNAVIVGADRIAMNGDTVNKVGTYSVALAALYHRIPFFVAAPLTTVDASAASGKEIPIEERGADEITTIRNGSCGVAVAPKGTAVYAPAFDMTPADLITAIITDGGVVHPPYEESLRKLMEDEKGDS